VYLKFLQALVVNAPFMRDWAGPGELAVFEDVAYDQLEIVQLLNKELGAEQARLLKNVEALPFATGSFGQVYQATLQDGTVVAIKVLKPSVSAHLRADLRTLSYLMKLAKFTKISDFVDIHALFDEFAETTTRETDYIAEARATKWFYDYFQNKPNVVIPKIYEQLSSRHVITQDYIGGVSLAKLLQMHAAGDDASVITKEQTGSDFWWQIQLVGQEIVHASLWSEFMMGDPHPGNIKFLPGNKIGLIDFGIVARTPHNKHAFFDLLKVYKTCYDGSFDAGSLMITALKFFDENLARSIMAIEQHGTSSSIFNKISDTSSAEFVKLMSGTSRAPELVSGGALLRIFVLLVNSGNRYGLYMDTSSAGTLRASRMFVQVIRQFSRAGEEMAIIHAILSSEIEYAIKNVHLLPEQAPVAPMHFDQALEVLGAWLSQVAENDPSLYAQLNASMRVRSYA